MKKIYDPIRQALRNRYQSVPGDILDAIMQDTLVMAEQLSVDLEPIAKIRFGTCDSAGYPSIYFEPVEDFDPDNYANHADVLLGSKAVIGKFSISSKGGNGSRKATIHPHVDLLPYPDGTPVYALRPKGHQD